MIPTVDRDLVSWPPSARAVFTYTCPTLDMVPGLALPLSPPLLKLDSLPFVRRRNIAPCHVPQVGVSRVSCEWGPICSQGRDSGDGGDSHPQKSCHQFLRRSRTPLVVVVHPETPQLRTTKGLSCTPRSCQQTHQVLQPCFAGPSPGDEG